MKRLSLSLAFLLAIAFSPPARATEITLLHVNDSHSHIDAWGPKDENLNGTLGGLAKVAAIVADERAADSQAIFVHAGDFMNGDLFFNEYRGVPELMLLKEIGLDALLLGNRDFQDGPGFLESTVADAWTASGGVPILGSNVNPNGHPLGGWITSSLIKDVRGVRIGLLGFSYPGGGPLAKTSPVIVDPYLPDLAPAAVHALRDAGADVVICLTHLGMTLSRQLAAAVPDIDVIVNAHDNAELHEVEEIVHGDSRSTFIVSAGHYYQFIGRLRLTVDSGAVSVFDYTLIPVDAQTEGVAEIQGTIDALKPAIIAKYGDVFHTQIATAHVDIATDINWMQVKRDSNLGNVFADAYRAWGGTQIGLEALGMLDDPLFKGAVVGADVFRSMSYGFCGANVDCSENVPPLKLATFFTTGSSLLTVLEKMLYPAGNAFPQISGMRLSFNSSLPSRPRIAQDSVKVGHEEFDPVQLYSITATDYVLSNLVRMGLQVENVTLLPDLAFDAARAFVEETGNLVPPASNRIRDTAFDDGD